MPPGVVDGRGPFTADCSSRVCAVIARVSIRRRPVSQNRRDPRTSCRRQDPGPARSALRAGSDPGNSRQWSIFATVSLRSASMSPFVARSARSAPAAWCTAPAMASAWRRSMPAASRSRAVASGLKVVAVIGVFSGNPRTLPCRSGGAAVHPLHARGVLVSRGAPIGVRGGPVSCRVRPARRTAYRRRSGAGEVPAFPSRTRPVRAWRVDAHGRGR